MTRHETKKPVGDEKVHLVGEAGFPYRSLSTIARSLLPVAEVMHRQGIPWRQVATQPKVSESALFIWRRLVSQTGSKGGDCRPE